MSALFVALVALLSASFSPVSHDIQCRAVPYGATQLVEYQLDPDEHIHEDQAAEVLGLDVVLDYSYPTVIGTSQKGCK